MTEKVYMKPLLIPEYIKDFSCIGSDCEDSCCIGWRVSIDEMTYKKYRKLNNQEIKSMIQKKITRNRSNPTKENFAKIKMGRGGLCPFLTEDKLCKIHGTIGHEYLSNTCAIYPRIVNAVNNVTEKSLTLSCPEAARLALLNPAGIDFEEIGEPTNTRGFIAKQLNINDTKTSYKTQKYFWELRIFSIQVLQDRSYNLAERLIILGVFYQKLQEQIEQGNVHGIPDVIVKFTNWMANRGMKSLLEEIPTQLAVQMKLCKELVDYRYNQSITNQRYIQCLAEMLEGIQYTKEATVEEVTELYKKAFEEYYAPFMKEHEYILENYLVNYVFKNLFPLERKNLFDDYVMLVIHYSIIKLHLIGMAGFHKGLTIDLVIKLIQSFAKTVEHNNVYLKRIFDLLKANEFTTLPYMAILVKN